MGGFLDDVGRTLFGGDFTPPKYNAPSLTQGTQQAIHDVDQAGNETAEQNQQQLMRGVSGTGQGLLSNQNSIGQSEGALGMTSSESQKKALSDRSQRVYGQELSKIERRAPMEAHQMQMEKLQHAQSVLQARDKFNLNVASSRIDALIDQNAARQAVLGQIVDLVSLGMGGTASASKGLRGQKPGSAGKKSSAKEASPQEADVPDSQDWSAQSVGVGE